MMNCIGTVPHEWGMNVLHLWGAKAVSGKMKQPIKSNSSGSRYHTILGILEVGSREVKCGVIIPRNGLCAGKKNLKRQKNGELPKQI
ncbi:hypothetical protein [Prevotella nigrescens]|uniref:hypothetical protein n=1 Tax=Prevotella nigrescens TaxID=28133 RepID=UPI0002AEA0F1|nr:hypothetical protein [Prevotella nigrescens]ELX68062.1 hypothetical protein HMPREF0662_00690 [Prevotella nigrescens F0103]QUB53984.1 hypothetical protein J4865_00865 [Prevotella nigrescens F0103]